MIEPGAVLFLECIKSKAVDLAQPVGGVSACIIDIQAAQANFPACFRRKGRGGIRHELRLGYIGGIVDQPVDVPFDEIGALRLYRDTKDGKEQPQEKACGYRPAGILAGGSHMKRGSRLRGAHSICFTNKSNA